MIFRKCVILFSEMGKKLKNINFGFRGLSKKREISTALRGTARDFLKPRKIKEVFGTKSFETSWGFIETLA